MRVVLTGARGFLGSYLAPLLRETGHEVLELSRATTPAFTIDQIAAQKSLGAFEKIILDFKPTHFLNLAWGKAEKHERDDPFHTGENVEYIKILCDFLHEKLPDCFLVGLGSQAELGPQSAPLTPSTVPAPNSVYGQGKLRAGQYLVDKMGRKGLWLRILTLYGPRDREGKFLPYLLQSIKNGTVPETSPGQQRWDFLHVRDAAAALLAVVEAKSPPQGLHYLHHGEAPTFAWIVETLYRRAAEYGYRGPPPKIGARPYAPQEIMLLVAEDPELSRATGWRPRIALEQGLEDLLSLTLSGKSII